MRLIVNADDFGLTESVSRGIIKGMQEGIITDTTMLTNTRHFDRSIDLAKEAGIEAMGVHLNLTLLKPLLVSGKVKSIVDNKGSFYRKPSLIPSTFHKEEVRAELRAQIEKFLSSGLTLTHIDTHHGFSVVHAEMFQIIIELSKEYRVPMRKDDALTDDPSIKYQLAESGVKTTDVLYVDFSVPMLQESALLGTIAKYKQTNTTVEIPCHPGFVDDELRTISSLNDKREEDLQLLLRQEWFGYMKEQGVELIPFSQL
ncbi:ChbG/HpnK family deacetylase [Bacillus safensis]|uniref:ChbG/HpnK family deacetylase n=1 Tax=Bacillus safensis TaxID=561879 RepID=UPI0020400651|nr:ChbG/HpnK family deacetylase [Bacillus safensis]